MITKYSNQQNTRNNEENDNQKQTEKNQINQNEIYSGNEISKYSLDNKIKSEQNQNSR